MYLPEPEAPEEYIYRLRDPFTDEIRYVGRTTDPPGRLIAHLYQKTDNSERDAWIADLRAREAAPIMEIVETITSGSAIGRERYWIKYHAEQGADLFNKAHNKQRRLAIVGYDYSQQQYKRQIKWFQQLLLALPRNLNALERFVLLTLIALCDGEEKPCKLQIRQIVESTGVDYSTLNDSNRDGMLHRLHNLGFITYIRTNKQNTTIMVHLSKLYEEGGKS